MSFNKSNLYYLVHIFNYKNILSFYNYLIFYKIFYKNILIKKNLKSTFNKYLKYTYMEINFMQMYSLNHVF